MESTLLCLLLVLSTHIYSGHSEDDDGQAKADLTIHPKSSQIFSGESVTLRCNIQRGEVTDWKYTWRKDVVDFLSKKHEYEISEVKMSDSGDYRCLGLHIEHKKYSEWSDAVRLTVTALPTASVKASPQGPVYSGETVTLQCDISDYRDWTYRWNRDNKLLPSPPSETITFSLFDQAGQFQCEGTRTRRPQRTYLSPSLTIIVAALPKATLTINPNPVYTGETVTLTCSVGYDNTWSYTWYKDNTKKVVPQSDRHTITGATFTISSPAVSDQSRYWCQGEIQSRTISSIMSDPVNITVIDRPVAVLTLQPNWPQIFSGETVTLRCDIQGGKGIEYAFYNSGKSFYSNTEPEYRISPAKNGLYTCEGLQKINGLKHSETSNAIQLNVLDKPQAVLSVSPQWLNPGDSVTLSCGVKESSIGWRFFWYRIVPYRAGLLSLLDRSYSVEPLSGNGTTEDSYTLIPAGPNHTGRYVCRAGRGDPVYDTLYSEPQFLWSGDLHPSVSLRTRPNRTQHFTSKSLSLSCEEKGNSTGWRLKRYRERGVESGCGSNWGSIAGSTCTIRSTLEKDSGVYWCESASGEYSNAVNITVDAGAVILENPAYPMTEGDSVTLRCTNRYQETNPNPKVVFYKDGVLIRNETTGEMTIPAVSKSDEGFYKCKSTEGESPESWVTVRGITPGPSTSVLVVVVVGLVVAGVLLAILLVLLCRYKNAKGSCCNRIFSPPQPHSTNLDPKQDQGSTQGQAPDAGYTRPQLDAAAATAGPSDVMYAQIQLKKLDKKKKKKPAVPKENPVYSEVKTGKATATGHAEVDLKQKAKAKKKKETETPPEADSVYSQVKPVTAPGP
ncbi:basement membrane-specific heparan sulfate proteoglycan core protein-like isoform X2 [Coregonus clupeaformis]|uniref:basement membrane-specific heparan sulfate proteoglycan core protein-like isoform X2 n=1 Tax=Coregonus clupeaformis TaxID=59861 RepID=UPI001E1C6AAA|nr:basement membrane-specific heparan sulfate proteoglycan core protein-like isoform X2 [Coregonus clupeaformis]